MPFMICKLKCPQNDHIFRAVTDPRNGERVALKKMPHIFQNLVTAKRVFRELRMLCSFRHENVNNLFSRCSKNTNTCSNALHVPVTMGFSLIFLTVTVKLRYYQLEMFFSHVQGMPSMNYMFLPLLCSQTCTK